MRQLILIALLLIPSIGSTQEDWGPADWLYVESWYDLCGGYGYHYGWSSPSVSSNDSMIIFHFNCFESSGIAYSIFHDGNWQPAIIIPREIINGFEPFISDHDSTIYFTSANDSGGFGGNDIWAIHFSGGFWGQAWNLGPVINSSANESAPSVTLDGGRLCFMRNDSIMHSDRINGQFGEPIAFPAVINGPDNESDPRISPDGAKLYFNRGSNRYQPAPMYVSHFQNGTWQEPMLLNGNINFREHIPQCPMIPGHNALPTFSCSGTKMYFWHFEPYGQFCEPGSDIFISYLPEEVHDGNTPIPDKITLSAWPNPFNSEIKIAVSGEIVKPFNLIIYNIAGQRIRVLPGKSEIIWDGKDGQGNDVSSGIYFVITSSAGNSQSIKITLLR